MSATGNITRQSCRGKSVTIPSLIRLALGVALASNLVGPAFAQYGGGGGAGTGGSTPGGYKPPKGGYSTGTGVGIAAGAGAGAAILYWTLRNRALVTGCVQSSANGLSFLNEKNKQTYSLEPGSADLKPGERVKIKIKRVKDSTGAQSFQVQRLVKNLGGCNEESALSATHSGSN